MNPSAHSHITEIFYDMYFLPCGGSQTTRTLIPSLASPDTELSSSASVATIAFLCGQQRISQTELKLDRQQLPPSLSH